MTIYSILLEWYEYLDGFILVLDLSGSCWGGWVWIEYHEIRNSGKKLLFKRMMLIPN